MFPERPGAISGSGEAAEAGFSSRTYSKELCSENEYDATQYLDDLERHMHFVSIKLTPKSFDQEIAQGEAMEQHLKESST